MSIRPLLPALVSSSVLLLVSSAHAQTLAPGFALNRFDPSERGSDWFVGESLDLRGDYRLALGLVADYSHNPLVVYDANSDAKIAAPIENQFFAHLGGNYTLAERLRLSLDVPLLLVQNGDGTLVNGEDVSAKKGANLGDIRLGADVLAFGKYKSPASFALGVHVYLPTGSTKAFTSDGSVRIAPRALLAGELGALMYSARLELMFHTDERAFVGNPGGQQIFGAATAGLRADDWVFGPELFTFTELNNTAFKRASTPAELLFGAHYRIQDVKLGAGIGPGLSRGLGAPDVRVLASVDYFPDVPPKKAAPPPAPPEDPDRDHDGFDNDIDACPDEPGVASKDSTRNGCPVLDKDHDGIPNEEDACVDEPGVRTDDPKTNGCPPPKDADQDGIPDTEDACPNEAGVKTDDPKTNGCPAPKDTDKDGVLDTEDACPNEAGVKTDDPKTNGCPAAHIEQNEIRILEPVKFATGSDHLLPESEGVLGAVMEVLQAHPEITKLQVRGHTDSRGGAAANLTLSKRRAASVVKWLTAHGIAATRLSSDGFGQTKPIDTNSTDEGRKNNRRVEFRITETAPQP